ncbi:ezrin-like [Petromyzon marinus]|uniref:ezrin-like n=1 Tax=Petromyzon marinus TaxID=7757 RepID=UPI003F6E698A
MPDPVAVRVLTMDADMDFEIQPTATGKQLLDQVARTIGLKEVWYFGLAYDNKHGAKWLSFNKKVLSQVKGDASAVATLRLWVRFYPEDVDEIIQDVTLRLLYLQTHRAVISDALRCPTETCVLLASYAAQATHGDLSDSTVYQGDEELLPERVVQQFSLTRAQWEEKVTRWHAEHVGMSRRQAMNEYLSVAQDLEAYGVSFFPISNSQGSPLWLGVSAQGLSVYVEQDLLTPKIDFIWEEIAVLTTEGTRFIIKSCDEDAPDFEFLVPSVRTNRRVLSACVGNHELYARRHGDTPPEITQLRKDEGRPHPRELPRLPHGDLTDGDRWGHEEQQGQHNGHGDSRRSSSSSVSSGIYEVPDELKKVQDSKVEMRNSQLKAVAASLVEPREGQQQQAGEEEEEAAEAVVPVGPTAGAAALRRAVRFHTLRRIRRGTTKQRIDEYEAL